MSPYASLVATFSIYEDALHAVLEMGPGSLTTALDL